MNNYPKWWDTTITIYNKFEDPQTQIVRWYKYEVSDCFWKYSGDRVVIDKTVLDTTNVICRIRKHEAFLEKHEWIALPNDEMSNYFTLSEGDIIIKGSVDDTIDEYKSGKRSTDILKKYKALQGCFEVQEFSINVGKGRGNEHYYVRGV